MRYGKRLDDMPLRNRAERFTKILIYDAIEAKGHVRQSYTVLVLTTPTPITHHGHDCMAVGLEWDETGFSQLIVTGCGMRLRPKQLAMEIE
jgi:hypothetical protein